MIEVICTKEKERLCSKLQRVRERNVALDAGLMNEVAAIIREVRSRGDAALIEYAQRFDDCVLEPADLRVSEETLQESAALVDNKVLSALREAISRVRAFHEHE